MKLKKQYIHFSFDDVWECLHDLTINAGRYQSVFENPFFAWLKKMHDKYGAVFSLYTFNYFSKEPSYDISNLPNCYTEEFSNNAHWLKFGFHAKDDPKKYAEDETEGIKADYEKFLAAISQATNGHEESIDKIVRLGWFAGTRNNVLALRDTDQGIKGLLSADDDRLPYYFNEKETDEVKQTGEMWKDDLLILRSQSRMESLWSIESLLEKIKVYSEPKVIELFSHECCFERSSRVEGYTMPELYEYVIKWAYEKGYGFGFAQEIYEKLGD